jgi:hypothetical protein
MSQFHSSRPYLLPERSVISYGRAASREVLDRDLIVKQTYVAGRLAHSAIWLVSFVLQWWNRKQAIALSPGHA